MDTVWRLLARYNAILRFFSRLPVPRTGPHDTPDAMPDFARDAWMLPLAGLKLSALVALALVAACWLGLPPQPAALVAVAAGLFITGALHEDGLADVADGFGGGRDKAAKLAIMKDSRIGAYGVCALVLVLALRASLYAVLVSRDGLAAAALDLMFAAAASRAAMLLPWVWLPSARPGGLAAAFAPPTASGGAVAGLVATVAWLVFDAAFGHGGHLFAPLVLAYAAALAVTFAARRHIGGYTGDVLGAAQQLAEVAFLAGVCAA